MARVIKKELDSDQIQRIGRKQMGNWFRGVFSRDRLPAQCAIGGYVINMQGFNQGDKKGTHWVALAVLPRNSIYFDSFGEPPPLDVQKFVPQNSTMYWSNKMVQDLNSQGCGYFALYFLARVASGESLRKLRSRFHLDNLPSNDSILREYVPKAASA